VKLGLFAVLFCSYNYSLKKPLSRYTVTEKNRSKSVRIKRSGSGIIESESLNTISAVLYIYNAI
jgi:hypothetical protein